ncbi:MAG: hypothetical protein WBM50_15405 [Acidimicrobiales bacterium]
MTEFGPPQADADHWPPLGDEPPDPPQARLGWSLPVAALALASAVLFHRYGNAPPWATVTIYLVAVVLAGPVVASDISSWLWAQRVSNHHQHWRTEPYRLNELGNLAAGCPCGALIIREDTPSGTRYLTIETDGRTRHRFTTVRQRPATEGRENGWH